MELKDFDFYLPKELIAQEPLKNRSKSRLLVVDRNKKTYEDKIFEDIVDYLYEGDVLVRNVTKVLPVRLLGKKEETGANVELLLLKQLGDDKWECLTGNAKVVKIGTIISFKDGLLKAECLESKEEGIKVYKFIYEGVFLEILNEIGEMPLPPYIHKKLEDKERYQTIYAKYVGSSAAPTAGFHFTEELFDKIKAKGVEVIDIILHIGLGTFKPVKEETIEDHKMHSEWYEITEEAANRLNFAKKEGRRIIAIGTTSTRTLESNIKKYHEFVATKENTDIFIYPGYTYEAIDGLITNFHLPESTLIMLVAAFIGLDFTKEIYKHAVDEKYRFFSFGDAMFIHG